MKFRDKINDPSHRQQHASKHKLAAETTRNFPLSANLTNLFNSQAIALTDRH